MVIVIIIVLGGQDPSMMKIQCSCSWDWTRWCKFSPVIHLLMLKRLTTKLNDGSIFSTLGKFECSATRRLKGSGHYGLGWVRHQIKLGRFGWLAWDIIVTQGGAGVVLVNDQWQMTNDQWQMTMQRFVTLVLLQLLCNVFVPMQMWWLPGGERFTMKTTTGPPPAPRAVTTSFKGRYKAPEVRVPIWR